MNLQVDWSRPVPLKDGARQNLIYTLNLSSIPDDSGVYVFGREWGQGFEALYVGQATRIRSRVKGQLNNLRLMNHIWNAKAGRRILVAGAIVTKRGQKIDRCMSLVEKTLIRYFLAEGHDLVNVQGTQLRRHEVLSSHRPRWFVPGTMYLDR